MTLLGAHCPEGTNRGQFTFVCKYDTHVFFPSSLDHVSCSFLLKFSICAASSMWEVVSWRWDNEGDGWARIGQPFDTRKEAIRDREVD